MERRISQGSPFPDDKNKFIMVRLKQQNRSRVSGVAACSQDLGGAAETGLQVQMRSRIKVGERGMSDSSQGYKCAGREHSLQECLEAPPPPPSQPWGQEGGRCRPSSIRLTGVPEPQPWATWPRRAGRRRPNASSVCVRGRPPAAPCAYLQKWCQTGGWWTQQGGRSFLENICSCTQQTPSFPPVLPHPCILSH